MVSVVVVLLAFLLRLPQISEMIPVSRHVPAPRPLLTGSLLIHYNRMTRAPFILMAWLSSPIIPPKASPNFHWSSLDSVAFSQALDLAYLEVAHWRKNCFDVPRGLVGKQFVSELAKLFRAVGRALPSSLLL